MMGCVGSSRLVVVGRCDGSQKSEVKQKDIRTEEGECISDVSCTAQSLQLMVWA